ncbi:acetate--CoA ligase family protein [Nonomuraea antri]|uniref:acetate--CoA ligase family protein n=1 Tax=Nonomuraea antri TaxID=2730852 RepID=UPI002E2C7DE2|nr:acetate--CoA ligase family protein [Nonomuraea antri]
MPAAPAVAEHEVKALLREAGVPVPRGVAVPGTDFAAVASLRGPLVLKAYGPGLVHKSEAGAVRLGLAADQVAAAAAEMAAGLREQGVEPAGFLVEEQAAAGVELIVGLVRDPGFGPVLLTGLGGVWTEALRDTALRLCPVSEPDVRAMLDSLRGAALLHGHRGRSVDVAALVKLIMAVGGPGGLWERLELGEFELNPVIATETGVVAVDARYLPAPPAVVEPSRVPGTDFLPLFEPRAVAVVGASTGKPNFGTMFLDFYRETGVPLVAVHPTADRVAGVPAVPSLAAAEVDYALVAVPAERCPEVVRQAAGVPFVQVMSGGFGEAGRDGLERELVAAARESGTRLLGPNCMGVYSPRGRQTFVGGGLGPPGSIALISQSGGLAGEVIKVGERRGLAFSRVVTVGNAADVTPAELLGWLARDDETRAVGLYLEDPRGGRALYEALSGCPLPVVLLVGGRSGQGRQAAASHTGGLVSDGRIWAAVAEQSGATLVSGQDDLIGVLAYFQAHGRRRVAGDRVLVIGPSGGASVLAADAFDRAGVRLDPLPGGVALGGLGVAADGNPLEVPVGPRGRPDLVPRVIDAIVARGAYRDVVAHVNVQSFFTYGDSADPLHDYARHLADAQRTRPDLRITLVTRNGDCAPDGVEDEVRRIAAAAGIPVYRTMEAAAVAVAAGGRHGSA